MGRKLSLEDEKRVAELVASDNIYIKEICEQFGLTRITVHRIAARHGVRRPVGRQPRVLSDEETNQIIELGLTDMSQQAIAEMFGLSQSRVSHILRYHGIFKSKGRNKPRRESHGSWKGGVHAAPGGYLWELVDWDDPMASMRSSNGYVLQHRLVMARSLGRPLTKDENVHHINGIKDDNRLENLELWTRPQPRGVRADQVSHCATCTCGKLG